MLSLSEGKSVDLRETYFGATKCIDVDVEAFVAEAAMMIRRAIAKELRIKE